MLLRLTFVGFLLFSWLALPVCGCFGQDLVSIFDGAEQRFTEPDPSWFADTQAALREEVERVGAALDEHGGEDASYWKNHLRWNLLEKNLGSKESLVLSELELSRRWMYSNRAGLEGPFFAALRERMDVYLDAAYTFSQPDLRTQFQNKVVLVREQLTAFQENSNQANAAALARTLGWFERTGQLTEEIDVVRKHTSFPNAQIVVTKPLIMGILNRLATDVNQEMRVVTQSTTPPSGVLGRERTLQVRGSAKTWGDVDLEMVPNEEMGELNLIYEGDVEAHCAADAGPVAINISTTGPVLTSTPVYVDLNSITHGDTEVEAKVRTRMTGVTGESAFLRRIAERRANEPASKSKMSSDSRQNAHRMLNEEMQKQVAAAIEEIRSEIAKSRTSMQGFGEVLAPVQREGAAPKTLGIQSTMEGLLLNVLSGNRMQAGAPTPCPILTSNDGVVARIHTSFFNNTAETIMAGKRFNDHYFMNYAKILQAELPLPLMVHSRSKRWAMHAAKQRPLVLEIPSPNRFHFTLSMQAFEYEGAMFEADSVATIKYDLVTDDYGDSWLERDGEIEMESELETFHREFLRDKLSAFFAPVLDGGGVIIPDGGTLGKVAELEVPEVVIDRNWIVLRVTGFGKMFVENAEN